METGTVTIKGQVVIPSKIRRRLGIKKGTKVCFIEREEGVVLRPLTKDYFEKMVISLADVVVESDDYRGFYLPFFSSITAWYKPILLNGAVFSSLRDPDLKSLKSDTSSSWRVSIKRGAGYVRIYHADK